MNSEMYLDHEKMPTALDVVSALVAQRSADIKKGYSHTSYSLIEFRDDSSIDLNGRRVESPAMSIPSRDIDYAAESTDTRNVLAMQVEQKLGVPHLPPIYFDNIAPRPVRPLLEVKARLAKIRRTLAQELKTMREIGTVDITDAQNPCTLGALEALSWLVNNDNGRDFQSILRHLFARTLVREREKLFHIRRHPSQVALHVCHDDSILEEVRLLQWAVGDSNPLDEVAHAAYGGYLGKSHF